MIGNLNQRANILARILTPDGGGGFGESWNTVATLWANVQPIGGDDVFGPDAPESRVRHRITVRRYAIVAAGQRVVIGTRTFRIHAALDDGPQSALMILLCEELP